jgi:hypothetical protein
MAVLFNWINVLKERKQIGRLTGTCPGSPALQGGVPAYRQVGRGTT